MSIMTLAVLLKKVTGGDHIRFPITQTDLVLVCHYLPDQGSSWLRRPQSREILKGVEVKQLKLAT